MKISLLGIRAQKDKQKAEVAAAELRGKAEAEKEALRGAVRDAEGRISQAQEGKNALDSELREYKVCSYAPFASPKRYTSEKVQLFC